MFMEKHGVGDSHPCLTARIRNLKQVTAKEWVVDKPAASLFGNWDAVERLITKELVTWGRKLFAEYMRRLDLQVRDGPEGVAERRALAGL